MKTIKLSQYLSLGAVLALCLAPVAQAADETANRGQLTAHDYKFVTAACEGGHMEVTLGNLAAQKAADPAVQDFGRRMATDHQKAGDELKQLATQKGANVSDVSMKKEQKESEKLQALNGADFDKAYMKNMVSDHKKDVKEFEKASQNSDDPDLKAWAAKTLPTLQDHLRMAESVEANLTGKTVKGN